MPPHTECPKCSTWFPTFDHSNPATGAYTCPFCWYRWWPIQQQQEEEKIEE